MIDFSIPPELEAVQKRAIAFMDEFVYLNESRLIEDKGLPADLEKIFAPPRSRRSSFMFRDDRTGSCRL